MLRVGSLARMAKRLLGFSLHVGDDSKDAVAQLQAMLPEARGRDAELIRWVEQPENNDHGYSRCQLLILWLESDAAA